jgi:hypothetical protein
MQNNAASIYPVYIASSKWTIVTLKKVQKTLAPISSV